MPVEVGVAGSTVPPAVVEWPAVRDRAEQPQGNDTGATLPQRRVLVLVAVVLIAGVAASYFYIHSHSTPRLTEKDTVVLADFTNTIGDPVFDGSLRQGLSGQLEQSPFLNLLSDDRIAQILGLMSKPKDARPTHAFAREVCMRTASAATAQLLESLRGVLVAQPSG